MSGVVLYECLTEFSSGHHLEKAELWLKEAARIYDHVILVTYGSPSFIVPLNTEIVSISQLPSWCFKRNAQKFTGIRQAFLNYKGWRAALRISKHRGLPALSLTTLVPGNLLASYLAGKQKGVGHLVMAIPGSKQRHSISAIIYRFLIRNIAQKGISFFCNTEKISLSLRNITAPYTDSIHWTFDPVELPSATGSKAKSNHRLKILIPGDDRAGRTAIANVAQSWKNLRHYEFLVHVPGASSARLAEIRATFSPTNKDDHIIIKNEYLTRDQLYELYGSVDTVLLDYAPGLEMGSGNILLALAHQKPVISTPFVAYLDMKKQVGNIGESFASDTPDSLPTAISRLLAWSENDWHNFYSNCEKAKALFSACSVAAYAFGKLQINFTDKS